MAEGGGWGGGDNGVEATVVLNPHPPTAYTNYFFLFSTHALYSPCPPTLFTVLFCLLSAAFILPLHPSSSSSAVITAQEDKGFFQVQISFVRFTHPTVTIIITILFIHQLHPPYSNLHPLIHITHQSHRSTRVKRSRRSKQVNGREQFHHYTAACLPALTLA